MNLPPYPISGQPISESWGRAVIDYIRSITLRPSAHCNIHRGPGGTTLNPSIPPQDTSAGGLDLSSFHFGLTIDGAVSTILSGLVFHPLADPITVPETEKTITANAQYIGFEYTYATGAAIILDPDIVIPNPDATHWRQPLFQFSFPASAITAVAICHLGDITVPAYASPAS